MLSCIAFTIPAYYQQPFLTFVYLYTCAVCPHTHKSYWHLTSLVHDLSLLKCVRCIIAACFVSSWLSLVGNVPSMMRLVSSMLYLFIFFCVSSFKNVLPVSRLPLALDPRCLSYGCVQPYEWVASTFPFYKVWVPTGISGRTLLWLGIFVWYVRSVVSLCSFTPSWKKPLGSNFTMWIRCIWSLLGTEQVICIWHVVCRGLFRP